MARTKKVNAAIGFQLKLVPLAEEALTALNEAAAEMDEVVTWICDEAVALGMKGSQPNWVNAQTYLHSKVEYLLNVEEKAKDLGYTSVLTALKALSQVKSRFTSDVDSLPKEYKTLPYIWLTGKPKGRKIPGFLGMTLSVAQRRHRVMLPLIVEVWQLIGDDEEVQAQLLFDYQRMSADDFEKELYRYIHDLEEVSFEEELEEAAAETFDDIVDTYNHIFDKNRIYGVTSEPMPRVAWDEQSE